VACYLWAPYASPARVSRVAEKRLIDDRLEGQLVLAKPSAVMCARWRFFLSKDAWRMGCRV